MLAIIPARGGSKGVPRKNVKELASKPLIYYSIKSALESKYISRIIVSTDDEEISEVAQSFGAEVPFLRPIELASDNARAIDTYLYTIEKLNEQNECKYDEFIVLQPTSPLRRSIDIDNAIEIFHNKCADSVISVVESSHPPQWYKRITKEGILKDYFEGENNLNRQEYEKTYIPNGAIYIFRFNVLKEQYTYYTDKTYPYIMPEEYSIDIDTLFDFRLAELLLETK